MTKHRPHHYIYRITDLVTGEYYVGMRSVLKDKVSYNLKIGGEGGCKPGPRAKGRKLSEIHRLAPSLAMKGKQNCPGVKQPEEVLQRKIRNHWARDTEKRNAVRKKMSEARIHIRCEKNNTLMVTPQISGENYETQ